MARKPRSRSREFKRNDNVVDFNKARARRAENRRKAQEKAVKVKKKEAPSKRQKKKRNRKTVYALLVILLLLACLAVSSMNIFKLEKQKRELEQQQIQLEETLKEKQDELKNINDKAYIEKQVREKLNMVYPDEILYMSPSEEKKANDN